MRLSVLIICGPFCNINASRLYVATRLALQETQQTGELIEVDFTGTTAVTAEFLATSFGRLLEDFEIGELKKRLSLLALTPEATELYRVVMDHGNQYKNNETYRKIIDLIQERSATASESPEATLELVDPAPVISPAAYVQKPTTLVES
jgi:hypothetical protein